MPPAVAHALPGAAEHSGKCSSGSPRGGLTPSRVSPPARPEYARAHGVPPARERTKARGRARRGAASRDWGPAAAVASVTPRERPWPVRGSRVQSGAEGECGAGWGTLTGEPWRPAPGSRAYRVVWGGCSSGTAGGLCGSCVLRRPPRIIRGGAPQDGDPGLPGLGGREAAGPAPRSEGLQDGQPIREPGCPRLREPSVEACVEWGKRSFGLF